MSAIASCSSPKPSPATTDGGYGSDKAIAAFDCGMIQGPLSANRFYEDNPTYTDPVGDSASWTISTPAAQGMDSSRLERASTTLADLPYTRSFLVIRRGALVFERYYHGSAKNQSNNVHSASKSIWGAAIGIAIDQGRIPGIDTTIASILPSRYVTVMNPQTRTITVRDLLTMTSGSRWDEDETETQIQRTPDWITATLKLPEPRGQARSSTTAPATPT
ncbi:serine hydrolase [Phytohabitans flavus]|uniref:serine hydrolase n=1 Tax=Phytohabitans flavus TaxID=1076124 RepID=UPI00362D01C7